MRQTFPGAGVTAPGWADLPWPGCPPSLGEMNRLFRAIVDGFGLSIGHSLWDEAKEELGKLAEEETPEQRKKREAERQQDEARARAGAERAEKERIRQEKRRQGEIDAELAAMKRKLGKK